LSALKRQIADTLGWGEGVLGSHSDVIARAVQELKIQHPTGGLRAQLQAVVEKLPPPKQAAEPESRKRKWQEIAQHLEWDEVPDTSEAVVAKAREDAGAFAQKDDMDEQLDTILEFIG
jgi:hypothetical protein